MWGEVEWTPRAAAHLEAREYRFISPVFGYDPRTRAVTRIEGAALVNDPALYMSAIASAFPDADHPNEKDDLTMTKTDTLDGAALAAALGLGADAGGAAILAAAEAAALAAAGADTPDPRQWVPRAEFDRAARRLETVETERAGERARAAVEAATAAGRIAPAQGDWALAYAGKDPAGFADYVASAPAIVTPARRRRTARRRHGDHGRGCGPCHSGRPHRRFRSAGAA